MKIIRSNVFETNSSSAHSLVLSKENKIYEDKWDWFRWIFGSTYEDIWDRFSYSWDKNGKIIYDEEQYEFNFCRGEVRVYDDPIHKTAFLVAYYQYREKEDLVNHIMSYSLEKINLYLKEYKNDYGAQLIKQLADFYIKKKFKKKNPENKWDKTYITSEFSGTSDLIEKIANDDELLEHFLFNNNSYISISGDEYQSAYLRLVGSEEEYYRFYDYKSKESDEAFSKRVDEVYPEDKYEVDYHI